MGKEIGLPFTPNAGDDLCLAIALNDSIRWFSVVRRQWVEIGGVNKVILILDSISSDNMRDGMIKCGWREVKIDILFYH